MQIERELGDVEFLGAKTEMESLLSHSIIFSVPLAHPCPHHALGPGTCVSDLNPSLNCKLINIGVVLYMLLVALPEYIY